MSLLMDALKKAERAKRRGRTEDASGPTATEAGNGLSLEPIANTASAQSAAANAAGAIPSPANLRQASSHLEELDAQFLADAKQATSARFKPPVRESVSDQTPAPETVVSAAPTVKPRPSKTRQDTPQNQSAAQNLFAAKQAEKPPSRRSFAITTGVLTLLAVCAIGGYFWWQLQPTSMLVAGPAALHPAPTTATVAVSPPAAVPPAPTLVAADAAPVAGLPSVARPSDPATEDDDNSVPVATKTPPQASRATSPPATPPERESPIRVTKAPLKVNPSLMRGFEAFNRGDLATAQSEYERAQQSDPRNTDALHGLAAVAVRQGHLDQAEHLYRKITEADPRDSTAMSALINMRGQIDPNTAESRLKTLAADQPELAAPHFSLGNLYARHGRWNDAQQAYFRAYSAEPDNPDIIYNLAISLEHLRQNKLAAQYYAQAIAAAQTRPAGFDKAQASARLRTLQP